MSVIYDTRVSSLKTIMYLNSIAPLESKLRCHTSMLPVWEILSNSMCLITMLLVPHTL